MTDGTDLVVGTAATLPAERRELMERLARGSKAERTWAAYASDWKVWETWATANGAPATPAHPDCVAQFLADMTITRKISTLRRYLASISVAHTLKGLTFDRKHRAITTIMRGAARGAPAPRRVRPLMSKQVRAILKDLDDSPADRRDGALLALGVASGCRRSELAGLDWARRGEGTGVIKPTTEGATITLFTSKTSQAEPESIYILAGLALKALKHWIDRVGIAEATPVFRAIGKSGRIGTARLTGGSIARIVKARMAAAGLEPRDFAGHSLRAGMITSAAEADVPEWRIRSHSRHRSDIMRQYIRPIEKAKASPTGDIGL